MCAFVNKDDEFECILNGADKAIVWTTNDLNETATSAFMSPTIQWKTRCDSDAEGNYKVLQAGWGSHQEPTTHVY